MDPIAFRGAELLLLTLTVPLFLVLGYKLFLMGAKGKMKVVGELKDQGKVTVTDLAPGSFCFLLGVTLAGFLVFDRLQYTKNGEHVQVIAMSPSGGTPDPAPSGAVPVSPVPSQDGAGTPPSRSATGNQTIAENVKPPIANKAPLPTTGDAVVISWLAGAAGAEPLSVRLSKAIQAMDQCKLKPNPGIECDTLFYGKFHSMPSTGDLTSVRQLEARAKIDKAVGAELARVGERYE